MNIDKAREWTYTALIPILLGVIISDLKDIKDGQVVQAITLAQFEIRVSTLEKYHPFPDPTIPEVIPPKHVYKPLDQRQIRPQDKIK